MNAIQILEDMLNETIKYGISTNEQQYNRILGRKDALKQAIEKVKSLPHSLSLEDINKLQRYDLAFTMQPDMSKNNTGEYVRYDNLIDLLK